MFVALSNGKRRMITCDAAALFSILYDRRITATLRHWLPEANPLLDLWEWGRMIAKPACHHVCADDHTMGLAHQTDPCHCPNSAYHPFYQITQWGRYAGLTLV